MEWSAYIPMDRRQAVARGRDLPDRTNGAALVADLSGFTSLTELLAEELGPRRGAEELTSQLNTVYDALIAVVHHYRGGVIGFSGDAVTCWFDTDDGLRATTCALNMQETMNRFAKFSTPNGTPVPLTLKVALATGPVRRFLVGDPQIQIIDVLAGATMDHLSKAGEQAKAREVIVGSEAASRLEGDMTIQEWRENAEANERFAVVAGLVCQVRTDPWPAAPVLTEGQVRPWLLPPVYQKLRSGQGQFLAELRPVVALFLKFNGLDYDHDDDAGERLDAYIRWVQQVLARHEGFLIQLTTGDKGSYLYAAFGAPVAHDDDAVRAVAAAVELRSPPSVLDFIDSVQIGISRGRMWTGAYGGQTRRTYGVLGDEVNIAARLMSKANPGQVLTSGRIVDAADGRYDFEALGSADLKGKRAPVPVFLALGPRPPSLRRPITFFRSSLVGREVELAQMDQALTSVLAGNGQVLCLTGVAGIGKSHLAAEFVERALDQGFKLATGACQSISQAIAYTPWRQVFRALLGLADESTRGGDQVSSVVRQSAQLEGAIRDLNPGWLLRLPLLGDLLGLPIPDNETTAALDPQLRQESLQALAVEIIQARARRQPLLLLIEDAHWMDEASSGLTLALGRAIGSVSVLLTLVHRPPVEKSTSLPFALGQLPYHSSLDLQELALQEIEKIVTNGLGGKPSKLALSLVQAFAQGNPFFTEELVNTLRESGQIYRQGDGVWMLAEETFDILHRANCLKRQDGEWSLAEGVQLTAADLDIPDSIHGIVLSRVDRLQEPHKVTLKVAGVIGRVFEFDLLASSHPAHPSHEELSGQMAVLEEQDFTRLEAEYPRLIYAFRHNITQEVAYQALLENQRRQLHRTVGRALEDLQPKAVERLAYHYRCSGSRDKALFYLDKAARKTQREYANETALNYYDQALALEERWQWLKGKAEVLHVLGRREEEKATLAVLGAISGVPAFDVTYLFGKYYEAIGDYGQAQAAVEKAMAAYQDVSDMAGKARCLNQLAAIAGRRGDYQSAQDWYNLVLELLQHEDDRFEEMTRALNGLGAIYGMQGDYERAKECFEQALVLSRESGNRMEEARALDYLGSVAFHQRRLAEAARHFQQALDTRRLVGDRSGEGSSLFNLAVAVRDMDDYDLAQRYLKEALAVQQAIGNRWDEGNVWNGLGGLYLLLGDWSRAQDCLQQGLRVAREIGDEAGEAYVLCNLGQAACGQGDLEAAEQLLARSLALAEAQDDRDLITMCLSHLGMVSLLIGRDDQAVSQASAALAIRQEAGLELLATADLATMAAGHLGLGDTCKARNYALQALTILDKCGGEGPEFPQRDYFLCYRVLSSAEDRETAGRALESAYNLITAKAEKITDPVLRRSFLEWVQVNREIVHEYKKASD